MWSFARDSLFLAYIGVAKDLTFFFGVGVRGSTPQHQAHPDLIRASACELLACWQILSLSPLSQCVWRDMILSSQLIAKLLHNYRSFHCSQTLTVVSSLVTKYCHIVSLYFLILYWNIVINFFVMPWFKTGFRYFIIWLCFFRKKIWQEASFVVCLILSFNWWFCLPISTSGKVLYCSGWFYLHNWLDKYLFFGEWFTWFVFLKRLSVVWSVNM